MIGVLVELSSVDAQSPYVGALLEACNHALHVPGGCALTSRADEPSKPQVVAIVSWDGPAHRRVHIEVGLRSTNHWRTRELSFSAQDSEGERFRTVGYGIATLVGEPAEPSEVETD